MCYEMFKIGRHEQNDVNMEIDRCDVISPTAQGSTIFDGI